MKHKRLIDMCCIPDEVWDVNGREVKAWYNKIEYTTQEDILPRLLELVESKVSICIHIRFKHVDAYLRGFPFRYNDDEGHRFGMGLNTGSVIWFSPEDVAWLTEPHFPGKVDSEWGIWLANHWGIGLERDPEPVAFTSPV